ncbi:GSCFA family protein [Rhizobium sp. RU35A]|uniref:GSCFA domain-containing protein n=1 Tax=Rhizobium sp. RU35A TaxID=1907414 RepID=UPI000953FF01|nr:GSCFA domain-containing protein [Rhizobium sp. RU35A]SIQ99121.1 GSCFA family protein [Rhizobium sp. RU35A]
MAIRTFSGQAAWQTAARAEVARWQEHIDRFSQELVEVVHTPKFRLGQDERVFCIGSCFARSIEEHLIYQNISVLSRKIICPQEEWSSRPTGIVNKFTTQSMRNEVEWVLEQPQITPALFEERADGWRDLQLCPGTRPVPLERAMERRAYIISDYFARLQQATTVIITLGLNEVWYDTESRRYMNAAPGFHSTRTAPERYELRIMDVATTLEDLDRIRTLLMQLNPDMRIIVTVSPVPLHETFSGRDVMTANMLSKSTLRVAADLFAQDHDNVDYFPVYDMVAMSPRSSVFSSDHLHVAHEAVERIMAIFLRLYMGIEAQPSPFRERYYLLANPDVEAAVRRGELGSGYEHWMIFGQAEDRPLHP